MTAINEYANPVIAYTFGIVNWTEQDIKDADILVRKSLNMHRMFEIRGDVDRLYIPRHMGGRGLISIWDSFKCTNIQLYHYLINSTSAKLKKCQELDKAGLFSICKRAEKFMEGLLIDPPHNLSDRSVI